MSTAAPRGQIISFYSFKGGVGRTMALANAAFLAAMNGLNVLVMDWDLEAPGLHHYFRGIMETDDMGRLKEAEGILDLAWEWRTRIDAAGGADDVNEVFSDYTRGEPFERRCMPIFFRSDEFVDQGRIDIIPAGARIVSTPGPIEYERALATFSWSDFLDRYTGGGMLEALRNWSAANYDLVLIDSRTGLADVAGICTMQLPDAVVLAFVLNRQNIEGVSRVAGAIRQNRGDAVKIWSVPMRVSREGTAEEADASARAMRELVRIGCLDRDQVERDMRGLLIKAEPNVPFMESLAPFNETDAALDPLTANLARLTREITGREIKIPSISEHWRDSVQSRLAPTLSTEAYLRQLMSAEPLRAARELHQYVESALVTVADGEPISSEYVNALVETSLAMQERSDDPISIEGHDTHFRVSLLLRRLYEADHDRWRPLLIQALQASLDSAHSLFYREDEAVALEEIDELLAAEPISIPLLVRRADTRLRMARIFARAADRQQQLSSAEDALAHISRARKEPGGDTMESQLVRQEALLQKADALEALDQLEEAADTYRKIVRAVDGITNDAHRTEANRLSFEANYRLMQLAIRREGGAKDASQYARAALDKGQPGTPTFLSRVPDICHAILAGPDNVRPAIELLRKTLINSSPNHTAQFLGRAPRSAAAFVNALANLIDATSGEPLIGDDGRPILETALDTVRSLARATARRLLPPSSAVARPGSLRQSATLMPLLGEAVRRFSDVASRSAIDVSLAAEINELRELAHDLEKRANTDPGERANRPRPRTNS